MPSIQDASWNNICVLKISTSNTHLSSYDVLSLINITTLFTYIIIYYISLIILFVIPGFNNPSFIGSFVLYNLLNNNRAGDMFVPEIDVFISSLYQ